MAKTVILFDSSSASLGPYALVPFTVECQATLVGVGLAPDDVITFEVMSFEGGRLPSNCGCYPVPGVDPQLIGVQKLTCPSCNDNEDDQSHFVRLTAANPVVILDYPVGPLIRARYDGSGIGSSMVWVYKNYAQEGPTCPTQDLTPELRGCPEACCVDTEWTLTGVSMCVAGMVYNEERSNCGTLRMTEVGPVTWTATGQTRCVGDTIEQQEIDNCGNTRWVDSGASATWTATGLTRCAGAIIENQEVNDCGDLRWVDSGAAVTWTATGTKRCTDTTVESQEVNNCGDLRWADTGVAIVWLPTGVIRCGPMSQAGGAITYDFFAEEGNQCGETRWAAAVTKTATPTGATRCISGGGTQDEYTDECCCHTAWFEGDPQEWVPTGETRCDGGTVVDKEINQCGNIRWTDTEVCCVEDKYIATMPLPCCGLAYRPTDPRDPGATVELTVCAAEGEEDEVIGYIYPAPCLGASVPVTEDGCESPCCGSGTVLGYAVNPTGDCPTCKTPDKPVAVEYLPSCVPGGVNKVLWSNGQVSKAGEEPV